MHLNFNELKDISSWIVILAFYCAFLDACVSRLTEKIRKNEDWKLWLQSQFDDDPNACMGRKFWEPILNDTLDTLSKICEYASQKRDAQTNETSDGNTVFSLAIVKCATAMMSKISSTLCEEVGKSEHCNLKLVLFANDEASELLETKLDKKDTYFHYYRYALATCPVEKSETEASSSLSSNTAKQVQQTVKVDIFSVMIDTQTRIADFSPTFMPDPSLRIVTKTKLYDPIYLIGWWNNNLPKKLEIDGVDPRKSIDAFLKGYF